jgi:hypothetical protein
MSASFAVVERHRLCREERAGGDVRVEAMLLFQWAIR